MLWCHKNEWVGDVFRPFKTFISGLVEDAGRLNKVDNKDCRIPAAALLVGIASVNKEMSEARRLKLHRVLKATFGLDDPSTVQLIDNATAAERDAIDLYHFTRQLNDALDDDGRRHIVKMMWEVIYVDGGADEFENNIIWRAADLLGVPSRQRIELRQQIVLGL
jgi:uncharacterized tellurite resistance protein B-like protein